MTAPTTADGATGGTLLANTTYRYIIAPITQFGEALGSAEYTQATANDGNNTHKITHTFTAYAGARYYVIYRSTGGAGTPTLYTIIKADIITTDSLGFDTANPVTVWVDTGSRTVQTESTSAAWTLTGALYTPGAEISTSTAGAKIDEVAADEEDIWIITTEVPGIDGYTMHCPTLIPMQYIPLGTIGPKYWFLILQAACQIQVEPFQVRIARVKIS
jgi:hypothetical protein